MTSLIHGPGSGNSDPAPTPSDRTDVDDLADLFHGFVVAVRSRRFTDAQKLARELRRRGFYVSTAGDKS